MKRVATILILTVMVCAVTISGRRVRRGAENSDYVSGTRRGEYGSGRGRDSGERDASVSGEDIGVCGGNVGEGYNGSPELAYNRDTRTPDEGHQVAGGRVYSKASATASATSTSYKMNHKTNIIPA